MKKMFFVMLCLVCFIATGCGGSKLKEGTYEGSALDNYGGQENTATAKVVVDANGKITSVYLDTTYTSDGQKTTKKTLGDAYGMYNHPYGSKIGEWDDQVEKLEQAIVKHQGTDFLALGEDGKTDAVSGCTIAIDALIRAYENAINKAK